MAVYLVSFDEPVTDEWRSLKAVFPANYIVNHYSAFIRTDGSSMIRDICDTLGMNNANKRRGFVTEVYNQRINGWNSQSLWEWIEKHD